MSRASADAAASTQGVSDRRSNWMRSARAFRTRWQLRASGSPPKARRSSSKAVAELQGELDMVNARRNLLDTMAQFVNQSDEKGAGASALKAHIDAIAASIPSASGGALPDRRPISGAARTHQHPPRGQPPAAVTARRIARHLGSRRERAAALSARSAPSKRSTRHGRAPGDFRADPHAAARAAQDASPRRAMQLADQAEQRHRRRRSKGCAISSTRSPGSSSRPRTFWFRLSKEGVLLDTVPPQPGELARATEHQYHDALEGARRAPGVAARDAGGGVRAARTLAARVFALHARGRGGATSSCWSARSCSGCWWSPSSASRSRPS